MRYTTLILVLLGYCLPALAQKQVKLYGTVTDFQGNPIDSVSVRVKNRSFDNLYETLSDSLGRFSMEVDTGIYYCIYAIRLADYRKTKLEYWDWNVPIYQDIEINPQYEAMEIYGVNVYEPQVTYMIYFRPMSLSKTLAVMAAQQVDKEEHEKAKKAEELLTLDSASVLDIAPTQITPDELLIRINGQAAKIVSINRMLEYARDFYFYGYTVQVLKPNDVPPTIAPSYDKVTITLRSNETQETGRAETFVKRL